MKISEPVKKETGFVCGFTAVCCVLVIAALLCLHRFSLSALACAGIGGVLGCANFFLMALTVQKTAEDDDSAGAKRRMQASHSMRTTGLLICLVAAVLIFGTEWPQLVALLLPLLFPRLAMVARGMKLMKDERHATETAISAVSLEKADGTAADTAKGNDTDANNGKKEEEP